MKSKLVINLLLLVGMSLVTVSCLEDESKTAYQQLQEDLEEIDAYLAANPPDPSDILVKDAYSGIRMVITDQPAAEPGVIKVPPTSDNIIVVAYEGRLFSDNQVFDSNTSFTFKISGQIIQGWKFALSMMTPGMHATVYIPSGLAYGTSGQGSIPKNAILVFDIHLKSVNTSDSAAQLAEDKAEIDAALDNAEIVAQQHSSGIRYVLQATGSGRTATLYDQVRIKYTGKILSTGAVFVDGIVSGPVTGFSSMVVNYIPGMQVGLQLMSEGDKATLYIPSTLAYGTVAQNGLPANSNVVFEVELLEIVGL